MQQSHDHSGDNRKQALVLKYSARRFDGGSEIDLIREIERKHAIRQLLRLHHMQMEQQRGSFLPLQEEDEHPAQPGETSIRAGNTATMPTFHTPQKQPAPTTPSPAQQTANPPPLPKKCRQVLEALIMGPMEILVGLVGIMTSILAIFTFTYMKQQSLTQQSKTVFRDCMQTFMKGWVDLIMGPCKAVQRALS